MQPRTKHARVESLSNSEPRNITPIVSTAKRTITPTLSSVQLSRERLLQLLQLKLDDEGVASGVHGKVGDDFIHYLPEAQPTTADSDSSIENDGYGSQAPTSAVAGGSAHPARSTLPVANVSNTIRQTRLFAYC